MKEIEFSIGKERYKLFKCRYYIKVGNEMSYYYSKAQFVRKAFELVIDDAVEKLELENALDRLI